MKIDINEIMSIIPHRYPFLLIDRVTSITLNESIVGIKNVTINEPQFTGHFPERPVMPGVLIIEAMAQLAAVLVAKSMDSTKGKEVFFMSIEEAKFRKIVEPGDTIVMYASILQNRGPVWKFKARSEVDGKIAAETLFTAMVKDKSNQ
ncbi:3-hydroxyacyl-ACP dehydratase FabZ [Candidatus Megaera venefica]|jgi:3-hydroxyacyl-[acyl-carrier-protein] dehydratase|uniref:3-hydroxyacyl-[acyl-carrier-protein] dehydratase FabZ n=1 Tax=Candidatus Megaera venefica TaxID=2055910 RepID=A0ABU5NE20_9RICK|nr:3-hydroxyacyl-ACP dehydratase FabZ [Candidatus Megaera venefica]MEA0971431.1 3-hydroxyacyl-ACP dehydratase FabZ [Candidatus Megaera venefica]